MEWMLSSSVLILIMLALRWILKGKISLRLQYALWAVVLVRLLFPWNLVDSEISVLNLTRQRDIQTVMESAREPIRFETQEIVLDEESGEKQRETSTYFLADEDDLNHFYSAREIAHFVWKWGCVLLFGFILISNVVFLRKLERQRKKIRIPGVSIPVYISPAAQTPCLAGMVHPTIYLPEQDWEEVQLRHVVEHELTHYRHKDHIISVLRCAALALHWYNPLVWWAARISKQDGELACDEGTIVRLGEGERIPYGKTLLEMTCEGKLDRIMLTATAMYTGKKSLKERITRIAKKSHMAAVTLITVIAVMTLAMGCTFTGATETNPLDNLSDEELIQKLEQMKDPHEIEENLIALVQVSHQHGVGVYERTNYGRHGRGYELREDRIKTLGTLLAQYEWSRASENALLRDSEQWMELVFGYGLDTDWKIRLECSPLEPDLVFLSAYGLNEEGRITCAAENLLFRAEPKTEDERTADSGSIYNMLAALFGEQQAVREQKMEETMVSTEVEDGKWLTEMLKDGSFAMLILRGTQSPGFAFQIHQEEIGVLADTLDGCTVVNDPDWNPPDGSEHPILMSVPGVCQMLIYEAAPYLYINVLEKGDSEEQFAMLKVETKEPDAPSVYEVASQLYRNALEKEYFDRTSQRITNTLYDALMEVGEKTCAEEMKRWRWIEGLIGWDEGSAQDKPALVFECHGREISFYDDQNIVKCTSDGETHYYFALPEEGGDWNESLYLGVYSSYLQREETVQWWMGADEPTDMTQEEMQECKVYLTWFDWTPIAWDASMETAGENIFVVQGNEKIEFFDGTNQVCYTTSSESTYYSLIPKNDEIRPIWDIMLNMYEYRGQ